ncbi:LysR family transcriptional regulator [Bowmanella dokdonensis]|uniref:LysR family transcriptional regulator n=1 Tax=Bowmanella dokdonensis TaxID=751969 RepID=A0A939DMW3_9ALTE|nr:LysR family transcriptional regulator [Bowmanella dokdonensis]MBN7825040.1 LysR family transcriptional regulator [Bowmanella dokdonensis]
MNINKLDLNLLVLMKVLYDCRSTTRAGEILHVSQPAISHALNRLRLALDDPLFERRGRRMVPTAKAERLVTAMTPALALLDSSLAQLHRFDPGQSNQRFVLGLNSAIENLLLPPLMSRLAQAAPRVTVTGQGISRESVIERLVGGEFDLAIDAATLVNDQIQQQLLLQSDYVVLGRQGHPLLAQSLSLSGYLAAKHVLVSRRAQGQGIEDHFLARHGHSRELSMRCQSHWTACQLAAGTDCLVTLPRLFFSQIQRLHAFSLADFPLPELKLEVYLYWHRSRGEDPANVWLREQILALIPAL